MTKTSKIQASILLTLLMVVLSVPVAFAGTYFYGMSQLSCKKWVKERKNESTLSLQAEQWVLGFVSGAGFGDMTLAEAPDSEALLSWVDEFCAESRSSRLNEAAALLVMDMQVQAR